MNKLFEDTEDNNIDNFNTIQLAEWIRKCRSAINLSDKKIYQEDYYRYVSDVSDFCDEWKTYANKHKQKYNSKEFSDAVKLCVMQKPKYVLITSDKKEIDITVDFENMQLQNMKSFNLISKSIDRAKDRTNYYSEKIDNLINTDDKSELKNIFQYLCSKSIKYETNVLEDESILITKSTEQIISSIKRGKWYSNEINTVPEEYNIYSEYLHSVLRQHNINKSIYYDFKNNKDKNRIYKKGFLINVGFYIGLTDKEMERFLKNEGYTMLSSKRHDDKIVADCFSYFFSQEYARVLLFKKGFSTLDMGK